MDGRSLMTFDDKSVLADPKDLHLELTRSEEVLFMSVKYKRFKRQLVDV